MARRNSAPLEVLDDDEIGGPSDDTPPEGGANGVTDAAELFGKPTEGTGPTSIGDWKTRRDAWDHSQFNAEFHLGPDRKNADGTFRIRRAQSGGSEPGTERPKRGKTAEVVKARPLPVSTIEAFLLSSHQLMSGLMSWPELKLDKDEANNLAVPIKKVADLQELKVDPRIEAYGMLMIAIVAVYGPKMAATMERMRAQKARNVTPKGGVPAGPKPAPGPAPAAPQPGMEAQPMSLDDTMKLFGGEQV